jgi:hypothetical protein
VSINAIVQSVHHNEDGSGKLILSGEERGQNSLSFDSAPHDVTCLNGRQIWGGDSCILVGEQRIADRVGYTKIQFTVPDFRGVKF